MPDDAKPPATFSHEEIKVIRHMLSTWDKPAVCPKCDSELSVSGPVAGGGSVGLVWRVECEACDRMAFVAENIARTLDIDA